MYRSCTELLAQVYLLDEVEGRKGGRSGMNKGMSKRKGRNMEDKRQRRNEGMNKRETRNEELEMNKEEVEEIH
jgi:hypothetical protein